MNKQFDILEFESVLALNVNPILKNKEINLKKNNSNMIYFIYKIFFTFIYLFIIYIKILLIVFNYYQFM